jgi:hypothetical protein
MFLSVGSDSTYMYRYLFYKGITISAALFHPGRKVAPDPELCTPSPNTDIRTGQPKPTTA